MIFQDPISSLSPRKTVAQLLMEPFTIHGIAVDKKQKVEELLEMVGLSSEQADKYPHQLSGGQARRVGIARALALQPALLVADEPTAGLDVSVAAGILNLMKDLREQLGLTYILITHNLNIIHFIADRVAVMYLGKLVEVGETSTLFTVYGNSVTTSDRSLRMNRAPFINSNPPMMLVGTPMRMTVPRVPMVSVKKAAMMPPPNPPMKKMYIVVSDDPMPLSRYGTTA